MPCGSEELGQSLSCFAFVQRLVERGVLSHTLVSAVACKRRHGEVVPVLSRPRIIDILGQAHDLRRLLGVE